MSPEIIEIIDTAVKIGLGALISGGTAYLLAKSKFSYETLHAAKERKIRLLEDIALKIGDSKFKLEESCHPFWLQVAENDYSHNQENIKKAISHLLEAKSIIGQAKALSLLLGEAALGDMLVQCDKKIDEVYFLMSQEGVLNHAKKMNTTFKEVNELFHQSYTHLEAAYINA